LSVGSSEMLNDPLFSGLFSLTTELGTEYRAAGGNGMRERTEYSRPDANRASTVGHMYPLKSFDRGLGWTFDFLRKARAAQLESDVADALYDVKANWEKQLLTRFFSSSFNTLATSGKDAPFVNGTSNVIDYTPPPYGGQSFANTHSHFDRKTDDATGRAAALNAGAGHLWEHGIFGMYDAIVPLADVAAFSALTKFVKPDRGIEYVATGTNAAYGQAKIALQDERVFGLYESDYGLIRLWQTARLPTDFLGVYKPYGANDQRNPLVVRYAADFGAGAFLQANPEVATPLMLAFIMHEFGVGVSMSRLNGYACYFAANGDYTAPTIS
jgi:hypothetical protein